MSALSAASMESYGRAYPLLVRLQALQELHSGYELHQFTHKNPNYTTQNMGLNHTTLSNNMGLNENQEKLTQLLSYNWENRLNYMSTIIKHRSNILSIRRSICNIHQLSSEIAKNWYNLSIFLRKLGKFDAAHIAIKNAENYGYNKESILIEICKIYQENKEINKALLLLEPIEINIHNINIILKTYNNTTTTTTNNKTNKKELPDYLNTEEKRIILAKRIRLSTQLMVESKQKHGNDIISRYKTVILLNKHWILGYFDLAKYYEFLYKDSYRKYKESIVDIQKHIELTSTINTTTTTTTSSSSKTIPLLTILYTQLQQDTITMCNNIQLSIEMYGNCLMLGSDYAMHVLPRLLTLWLSFTAMSETTNIPSTPPTTISSGSNTTTSSGNSSYNTRRGDNTSTIITTAQYKLNETMLRICTEVSSNIWYMAMSQIVSRVLHRNEHTVKILITILQKILISYPKEGIWHLACLMFSFNTDRKKIAKKLLQDTYKIFNTQKQINNATMLIDSQKIYTKLIDLASFQCKERKLTWVLSKDIQLENFIVPIQNILYHNNPLRMLNTTTSTTSTTSTTTNNTTNNTNNNSSSITSNYYHTNTLYISHFHEIVDVANSKAKPKTIILYTLCGKTIKFLCKQEKDGDLRKDSRMMEFNNTINRILLEYSESLNWKHLNLRTYSVICLNEECGILEWVNNTECLRSLINKAHSYSPELYPNLPYKNIYTNIIELQNKNDDNINRMMDLYNQILVEHHYKPCFHKWFIENFSDPTEWYLTRQKYIYSTALWCIVGHIIGLGDRHTENILIDITNGEMVHVDFDCLFDKGLTLQRPEIVPFRLTPNLIDAMGIMGIEGCYRNTLEIVLGILREHKDTLLSILEPFLRDPTVCWSRSGRAQRQLLTAATGAGGGGGSTTAGKTRISSSYYGRGS